MRAGRFPPGGKVLVLGFPVLLPGGAGACARGGVRILRQLYPTLRKPDFTLELFTVERPDLTTPDDGRPWVGTV